jgi:cytochrome P450
MNETLRIEPPIPLSSSFCLTENLEIAGTPILKGQMLQLNIYQLHHNPDQWGPDHDQYIPERFLKRGGGDVHRSPYSFLPFLGGKRVCIGKTFAENTFMIVLPMVLKAF